MHHNGGSIASILLLIAMTQQNERVSSAQLRRAAGSQSLEKLQLAIQGWSVHEINDMANEDGKNPVHMAAWQGCIENLQYLLDMGCAINIMSTGKYSYGKTPIFFACTRSRNEIVDYLLEKGANVKIVNNKGQSVLSIASSHLEEHVIAKIQQQERAQTHHPWRNYRATHSDGLEYGDLDPRFLDRPLRETDIRTPLAINPTTKISRRGSFLRRNPHLAEKTVVLAEKTKQPKKKERRPSLNQDELDQLSSAWDRIENNFKTGSIPEQSDMMTVVHLSDKCQWAWIPDAVDRLQKVASTEYIGTFIQSIQTEPRESELLNKLLMQLEHPNYRRKARKPSKEKQTQQSNQVNNSILSTHQWTEACQAVENLHLSMFEDNDSGILRLVTPPVWIDCTTKIQEVMDAIAGAPIVAIDTEWGDLDSGTVVAATIQIAVQSNTDIVAYVVDLLKKDDVFQHRARWMVKSLFETKMLLGFAVGHDIPKLEAWVGERLPRNNLLDLQLLWTRGEMPGLATCVAMFSSVSLSKKEQCSAWGHRPLSTAQLEYAGLDAAVLLPLLAEKHRDFRSSCSSG